MKYRLLILFAMFGLVLAAQSPLPISTYDYGVPENNVSAIAIGMGGINLTNADDPFASYGNPALLANNETTMFYLAYRLADNEKLDFWEAASVSNFLQEKQFKYFTLVSKQAGFSYQPMAAINISRFDTQTNKTLYYDYKLDKLQLSLAMKDKNWPSLTAGVNLKYITGRLVYLVERREGNQFVREHFIDDKIKGASGDLGLTMQTGNVSYGLTLYDVLSRLWWENYDPVSIQRRIGTAVQYGSGASKTSFGIQSKISKKPETTYHVGYSYAQTWDSKDFSSDEDLQQGMDLRIGFYSHDFYGADNINLTLGGGYHYQMFRFDFSLNSRGLKLADSEFLFSMGIGF
ncbi:MAG: hypothetical protein LHW64_01805 [Candidatus Cloacimonetes bacterium]|nr:hypothetical protein [Candidatus Cloacimonadota bacterium]MDY0228843.1 hypothetical protein [Candidatus Cloacimonadaceae bacterium]